MSWFNSDHTGRASPSAARGQTSAPFSWQGTTAIEFYLTSGISPTGYSFEEIYTYKLLA